MTNSAPRILSGIQPTGNLHLGNYLGAIAQWVRMQQEPGENIYFLADLHAITGFIDPAQMRANVYDMTAALLAAGIDPERAILFNQARVPEHSVLAWMLFCVARIGWLNRMTQFKDKAGKNRESASVGLYAYPVLQAADVLLYDTTHVPVGEDQKQHLELARDIAAKFNKDYAVDCFTLPEPIIVAETARIMSLRDGTKKMSKSDPSDAARINLVDSDDDIAAKVRKAKTDADRLPGLAADLEGRPEARNLVGIYAALAGESPDGVCATWAGEEFSAFKPALVELLVAHLGPIRAAYQRLRADEAYLDTVLQAGATRARALAAPRLAAAQQAMGLIS